MIKRLLIICALILSVATAHAQGVPGVGSAKPTAAVDGPNTWYYSCSNDGTAPSWTAKSNQTGATVIYDSTINIPTGGTLTKFAIYSGETYAQYAKLALYDTSGNQLSVSCTTSAFVNDTWNAECTLGTPYAVTSGNYLIKHIVNLTPYNAYYYTGSLINRNKSGMTYNDFPYTSTTADTAASRCSAVRAYID